jgi:raffinose/stachyose/melibiose transport system permease protein
MQPPAAPSRKPRLRFRNPMSFGAALPFLMPALILYGAFLAYPIISSLYLSFFKWNGFATSPKEFAGLDNYIYEFTEDPVFWTAFTNTLIWVVLSLLIPTSLGLLMAVALNRKLFARNFMRSVFYIPAVLASIAVATMWRWIYNPTLGLLNSFLEGIGLGSWAQQWIGNPNIALYSVFIAFVWQTAGFNMVLFLAGLQSVPAELVDAAKVDGATPWQTFRNVTWPALQPTTAVVVVLTIISSLKVFDLIVGMTGGGPAQSTQVLALWSYSQSFSNHNFGEGNALATILLILTLALVVPYLAWSLKENEK